MSDADETGVVTVFLRNGSDVLLLRRSDAVGSYRGQWGAVAGHAEGDPERLAREEIREETGLDPGEMAFVRRGASFPVEDPDHGTWRVNPFLFDCPAREVTTNRETTECEWVQPPAILDRGTVPRLWESYRRVAPTVADVCEDREHGSEYVSRRAVEVLRDAAAALDAGVATPADRSEGDDWAQLAALAEALLDARESMAVVANRVNRAMHGASDADGGDDGTGPAAAVRRSAESRPGGEGRGTARALAESLDVPVTLCADAGVAHALDACDADAVLVGADTVLADGSALNKVGTRTLASAAAAQDVPVYVAAHADKVAPPGYDPDFEPRDAGELLGSDAPAGLGVEHPTFDATPPGLVDRYLTDRGALTADEVGALAARAEERADWPR